MRNIEMTEDVLWNEWREIIQFEFEHKLEASGINTGPAPKGITVILLLTNSLSITPANVLPDTIKIIRERGKLRTDQTGGSVFNTEQFDDIAMMGHRIGMLENLSDLNQYMLDIHRVLKVEGQVILTSFDLQMAGRKNQLAEYQELSNVQFPNGNLIGPYFNMVRFNTEAIKYQAARTNWQFQKVYQRDEGNYLVLLSGTE